MVSAKLLVSLAVLGTASASVGAIQASGYAALAAGAPAPSGSRTTNDSSNEALGGKLERALSGSHVLWATVDVCNPKDQPDTIGIRGSMPSDGHKGDTLFMRFRVQYEEAQSKQWVDVAKNADSGFQPVHDAGAASQAGRNFQLVPTTGAFTLRGVVSFQWRRGKRVMYAITRTTMTGHESLAGADPKGFSAATCTIS
jgi:hypothetical protein